jgi:hypothetical protein
MSVFVFEQANDETMRSAKRALAGSDVPYCSLSANKNHSPRTLCDPVHDHRMRGGSETSGSGDVQSPPFQIMMIDRALLKPTARAVA